MYETSGETGLGSHSARTQSPLRCSFPSFGAHVSVEVTRWQKHCRVLPESGGVGTPAETLFTMGKGLKEFRLCDSRRLRKKPQDAQDDVTELFDLFDVHFWVGKVYRIWTLKGGPPQFTTWMFVSSFLPFVISWFLANF